MSAGHPLFPEGSVSSSIPAPVATHQSRTAPSPTTLALAAPLRPAPRVRGGTLRDARVRSIARTPLFVNNRTRRNSALHNARASTGDQRNGCHAPAGRGSAQSPSQAPAGVCPTAGVRRLQAYPIVAPRRPLLVGLRRPAGPLLKHFGDTKAPAHARAPPPSPARPFAPHALADLVCTSGGSVLRAPGRCCTHRSPSPSSLAPAHPLRARHGRIRGPRLPVLAAQQRRSGSIHNQNQPVARRLRQYREAWFPCSPAGAKKRSRWRS